LKDEVKVRELAEEWLKISSLSEDSMNSAYIAHFDILGYHELMKERRPIEICRLIEKVRILPKLHYYEQSPNDEFTNMIVSYPSSEKRDYEIKSIAFSDNILLSTLNNWRLLLLVMIDIQSALIKEGIFIRGAMVYDKIYHSETLVGGEGLIKAHHLESKVAVYPRIIVDKSYIDEANAASKFSNSVGLVMDFLKLDFDGNYFLDYLKKIKHENKEIHKNEVNKAIEKYAANDRYKPEVLAKYEWCKTYHDNSV